MADLTDLSAQADSLSTNLYQLQEKCAHESTSTDIFNAAQELKLLAAELSSLDAAVKANRGRYTAAFGQDLAEIRSHLSGIFEDTADCCREMQKADDLNASAVGWLAKKRYVKKLQKHLEANKTTLVVMRTVLHHGKEYGKHSSPGRLAESSPHVLQEDRVILETVFASRNAIKDLHSLGAKSHEHTPSTSSVASGDTSPSFEPGAHGRKLSSATGVDTPIMEDVLPQGAGGGKRRTPDALARRFSRRGVRLAVHSSIIDTNAHEVPFSLRNKWIHQAQLRHGADNYDIGSPSTAQLSKISEVNSNSGPDEQPGTSAANQGAPSPGHKTENKSDIPRNPSSPSEAPVEPRQRRQSVARSPLSKRLGGLIAQMSLSSLRERRANNKGSPNQDGELNLSKSEMKRRYEPENEETEAETEQGMSAKERPGWSYRLTRPFVKPDPTTPDYENGF